MPKTNVKYIVVVFLVEHEKVSPSKNDKYSSVEPLFVISVLNSRVSSEKFSSFAIMFDRYGIIQKGRPPKMWYRREVQLRVTK